jgi:hypothetical protein
MPVITPVRLVLAVVLVPLAADLAHAREAHVTATTRRTVFIDAGAADGLVADDHWQVEAAGGVRTWRVLAVARHEAVLEVDGAPLPAVGTTLPLPTTLRPPAAPPPPRPPPQAMPVWRPELGASALPAIRAEVARVQPALRSELVATQVRVRGELSASVFLGGDVTGASTSWEDLSFASQLTVEAGDWRYDHLIDARVTASPEYLGAPLQHGQAELDVYQLRLEWAPPGGRVAAALGRQPSAPLGELGVVDGMRARVALGYGLDATVFAGLRPATDLGVSAQPRAGVDLGFGRSGVVQARADLGLATDLWHGAVDRTQAAAAVTLGTPRLLLVGDLGVDAATDASGDAGARVSHASMRMRVRAGAWRASASGGHDQPFMTHQLASELPGTILGARSFGQLDAGWAHGGFDLGAVARGSTGDGFSSVYTEISAASYDPTSGHRYFAAPHLVVGGLATLGGLRVGAARPWSAWALSSTAGLDHLSAGGSTAWSGFARLSADRPLGARWRLATDLEARGGDGPPRVLVFVLVGYRLGE